LLELELELIQTHMTQKPLLWVEVGAHVVRNRPKCGGVGGQAQVSRGAWKLELELIQTRMIQKPLLWVEVGVRVVFEILWAVGFSV
jgi:hypothetical protein